MEPAWQHMLYMAVDTVLVRTVLALREAQPMKGFGQELRENKYINGMKGGE
jgi:hypothetical protein